MFRRAAWLDALDRILRRGGSSLQNICHHMCLCTSCHQQSHFLSVIEDRNCQIDQRIWAARVAAARAVKPRINPALLGHRSGNSLPPAGPRLGQSGPGCARQGLALGLSSDLDSPPAMAGTCAEWWGASSVPRCPRSMSAELHKSLANRAQESEPAPLEILRSCVAETPWATFNDLQMACPITISKRRRVLNSIGRRL
jgi:hypothetical protein